MDRRTFIASSAALGPTTAPSATTTIDPIAPMFARWEAALREWQCLSDNGTDWDTPEMLALEHTRLFNLDRISNRQAQSLEGLRCQITALWHEHGLTGFDDPQVALDPELRLKCNLLLGIERLTRAAPWQPPEPKQVAPASF
jgi:hypothetical protein